MKNEELKRIENTLNREKEHEYYVYMLLTGGNPFYIGKGKGTRVFSHEADAAKAEEIINSIKDGREDPSANYEELSDKIKTIIRNKGKIEKVIVKWGLTENEAYMCESAMINMYRYLYPGVLTNIQNGHETKAERESLDALKGRGPKDKTKAREVGEFLEEVAIKSLSFYQAFLESGIDLGKDEIRFFKIDEALAKCGKDPSKDDTVYQCTRTSWDVAVKDELKYAVGLEGTVVKGAYVIKKWNPIPNDTRKEFVKKDKLEDEKEIKVLEFLLSLKNCLLTDEYVNGQWDPIYSKSHKRNWLEHKHDKVAEKILRALEEDPTLSPEELAIIGDLEKYKTKWQEISSITGVIPVPVKKGKKKLWSWNGRNIVLGKTLKEKDFQKRLFRIWYVEEKMKKENI